MKDKVGLNHKPGDIVTNHVSRSRSRPSGGAWQVEGTCVGTGMGFDPAFYYYQPQSVDAARGYGPVLLTGAEMIKIIKSGNAVINDGALQFGHQPANMESAR